MSLEDLFRIVPVEDVTNDSENNTDVVESSQPQEIDEELAQPFTAEDTPQISETNSEVIRLEKMIDALNKKIDNIITHAPTVTTAESDASLTNDDNDYVGLRDSDWLLTNEEKR